MPTPPTQIGPYRIVRPLGQGGMGAVYEAIQQPIERRVALKVLLPQHAQNTDALERFFNEARAVNRIEHPGIVQVSDYGQAPDGTAFLVMEYLRGETLDSRLERLRRAGRQLPWLDVVQLAAQLADALSAAHAKAIVHRDLKPGNVMLVHDAVAPGGERAKILDFGIAKLTQGTGQGTATNALIGTPQYMSPEQCRGAGGVDAKTDVYALGVMLYEMVAGRPPFVGENTVEYLGQHAFKEPPSLYEFAAHAHPPLVTLIHRLLIKDKAARPAMREVGQELAQLISSVSGARPAQTLQVEDADATFVKGRQFTPLSTLSGSLGQTEQPTTRLRRRIVGAMVVAVMTGGLGAVLVWRSTGEPPTSVAVPPSAVGPAVAASPPGPAVPASPPAVGPAVAASPSAVGPAVAASPPAVGSAVSASPTAVGPATLLPAAVPSAPAVARPAVSEPVATSPRPGVKPAPLVPSPKTVTGTPKPPTTASTPQPAAREPAKANKVSANTGSGPAIAPKPSLTTTPTPKPTKPAGPTVRRPVRYED